MATFEAMRARALADPEVRAEYDRLNREEFALLDQMLAARRDAGLTQAQVAERWRLGSTRRRSTRCAATRPRAASNS
jgi:hypothetical protein